MTQEAKHTPAPWRVQSDKNTTRVIGDNGSLCGLHKTARNHIKGVSICPIELKANACLIAAAPELLEALEVVEAQIESFYTATITNAKSRDENTELKSAALDNVRAAIAKARGQS